MLKVAITSLYEGLLGEWVLDRGELRWESKGGNPFGERILATDTPGEWITLQENPERWMRRLPGYLALRSGHLTAEITEDT